MSDLELFADEIDGVLYAAVVRKGVLVDLYADPPDRTGCWASLYLGKVSKIDTKLDAAIVDLGDGLAGYLPAKHVRIPDAAADAPRPGIAELLKGGDMILVQVKSEAKRASVHENHKLPRLTMKLYVPGLFLTYSPHSPEISVAGNREGKEITALAEKLKSKGGWIIHRSAEDAGEADISREAAYLQALWQKITEANEDRKGKPGRLITGPNAVFRALVDHGVLNFDHIYTGTKPILDFIIERCMKHFPPLAESKRLRLFKPEKPGQSLFDIHDIHAEIESLKDARVYIEGGGTIIIENTSAMTVIDVNQGGAGNISEVNQSAAREIARQARLRALSGAILVDFINMERKNERVRLIETLESLFSGDTGTAQVHGFTRLGIIEITRKRRTATLLEKLKK